MRPFAPLLLALIVLVAPGASCTKSTVPLPDSPPSIAGTLTAVDVQGEHLASLRVEAEPGTAAGSDKAVVHVSQSTALVDGAGQKIGLAQFKEGRKVRAWFTGPVRESYPVQADASTIVLEPADK